MQNLKDPVKIKDIINEKTKKLLDEGKLQEAKKLIDLGEKIPQKLSREVILAEHNHKEFLFKRAKKSYLKAADLAEQIQETEMAKILRKKAERLGDLKDILKTFDAINKGVKKTLADLKLPDMDIYENIIPLIEKNIKLSNSLEEYKTKTLLVKLKDFTQSASKRASELKKLDENIKDLVKNL